MLPGMDIFARSVLINESRSPCSRAFRRNDEVARRAKTAYTYGASASVSISRFRNEQEVSLHQIVSLYN